MSQPSQHKLESMIFPLKNPLEYMFSLSPKDVKGNFKDIIAMVMLSAESKGCNLGKLYVFALFFADRLTKKSKNKCRDDMEESRVLVY